MSKRSNDKWFKESPVLGLAVAAKGRKVRADYVKKKTKGIANRSKDNE